MKTIEFYPASKDVEIIIPPPKPASECLPKWYKDIKPFENGKPVYKDGVVKNKTVKLCLPFFDSLTSGYIQESWCDIHVSHKNGNLEVSYSQYPSPFNYREKLSLKVNNSFLPIECVWQIYWLPKLSDGYSALFTHPLNRFDLPFVTSSGIIDSDKFFHSIPANYPFVMYENFEGIIPQGTPLYQIIPIKRDNWKSESKKFNEDEYKKRSVSVYRSFVGSYKKFFYQKKSYK